jgi:hypothetical protein
MAEVCGYDKKRIEEALVGFVGRGHGSAMSTEQNINFRNEVLKRCDEVLEKRELKRICMNIDHDLNLETHQGDLPVTNETRLIFCDLDGVLVEFCEGVRCIFSKHPQEIPANVLWSRLAKTPNFYTNLPWMRDGKKLWESIKHLNPTIITAPPRGSWARIQKMEWVRVNLGSEAPVIATTEKQKYCPTTNPPAILTDDRIKWAKPWEEAGGTSILHENTDKTIRALTELGVEVKPNSSS